MGKKSKYLIFVIIVLLVVIGFMMYSNVSQDKTVQVGDLNFKIPNGYNVGVLNPVGDVNLTDGTQSVCIGKLPSGNVHNYIKQYVDDRVLKNDTISSSNMTINNILVYKCLNENTGASHYWFIINGNVYTIYSWGKTNNMDSIVSELLNSLNS